MMNSKAAKCIALLFSIVAAIISCNDSTSTDALNVVEDSVYVSYHDNGSVNESGIIINGKVEGKYMKFFNDGTKHYEYQMRDGAFEGPQKTYNRGSLISIIDYKKGIKNGYARFYDSECGTITEEGNYESDKREGLWYSYRYKELSKIIRYEADSVLSFIYENLKYKQTVDQQPMPLSVECDCCNRTIE